MRVAFGVLAVACVLAPACKKKEERGGSKAVLKMSDFKSRACACKDAACAHAIVGELQKWSDELIRPGDKQSLDALARELDQCVLKATNLSHARPLACPPGRPTRQPLAGDASVNAAKLAITDPRQSLKLRAMAIPASSYLTIFGQRPLTGGDPDHTYDVVQCIDSSMAQQWQQIPLMDATGVAYLRLRMRMWNPTGTEIQLEARQDPGTGEPGPTQNASLKCKQGSYTLDDLVHFERPAAGPSDAGVTIDGAVP